MTALPLPPSAEDFANAFQRARAAFDVGQADAVDRLRSAVAIDPAVCGAWNVLGEAFLRAGLHYEAMLSFTRALRIDSGDLASTMRAADLHALAGRWNESEELARRVAEEAGNVPAVLYLWAFALYGQNRPEKAQAVLRRLLAIEPTRHNARHYLGMSLRDLGDLEGAYACFTDVVRSVDTIERFRSNPLFAQSFFGKATLARLLGYPDEHVQAEPLAAHLFAEGRRLDEAGDFAGAARSFATVLALRLGDGEAYDAAWSCCDRWTARILEADWELARKHNEWFAMLANRGEIAYRMAVAGTPRYYAPSAEAPTPPRRRKVYDCFQFFEELDMLELRMTELDECVDHFVVVESPWTHQCQPKRLVFLENRERFARFADKIIHVVADRRLDTLTMAQENYQRDCIFEGLTGCSDDDLILISDLDEIPRKDLIRRIAGDPRLAGQLLALSMLQRPYFVNYEGYEPWSKAVTAPFGLVRRMSVNLTRYITLRPSSSLIVKLMPDAGWHMTWMGGAEAILRKHGAYSHTELSIPSEDDIRQAVSRGDIIRLARAGRWVDHRMDAPETILANRERYVTLGWIHDLSARQV